MKDESAKEAEIRYPVSADDYEVDLERRAFIEGAEWMRDTLAKEQDIHLNVSYDAIVEGKQKDRERIKELESESSSLRERVRRLEEDLQQLVNQAYDLREHCQDHDYIDFNEPDSDGAIEFNNAMEKAKKVLESNLTKKQ
jgi:hypothetical protein